MNMKNKQVYSGKNWRTMFHCLVYCLCDFSRNRCKMSVVLFKVSTQRQFLTGYDTIA